jgi:hypothetical protein
MKLKSHLSIGEFTENVAHIRRAKSKDSICYTCRKQINISDIFVGKRSRKMRGHQIRHAKCAIKVHVIEPEDLEAFKLYRSKTTQSSFPHGRSVWPRRKLLSLRKV